jgi:hypothetical protein
MTLGFRALITGLLLKTAETTLDKAAAPQSGIRAESLVRPQPAPPSRYAPYRYAPARHGTAPAAPSTHWAILS